eukprot:TRINITY_DN41082_c1_g1_i1.p1 TRINITY_DN41082_c1_g1~~TRINITY_DN41082_c1_g1_i1.p1  ORF type:complete len:111 (-),score=21.13 TRINITY_DN41082_c1_g1_i1:53-385(-)
MVLLTRTSWWPSWDDAVKKTRALDEVMMLTSGIILVARLMATMTFENNIFGTPQLVASSAAAHDGMLSVVMGKVAKQAFPGVVQGVVPGIDYIRGERVTLNWKAPPSPSK